MFPMNSAKFYKKLPERKCCSFFVRQVKTILSVLIKSCQPNPIKNEISIDRKEITNLPNS